MNKLVLYLALIAVFDLAAVYFGKMYSLTEKIIFVALCILCLAVTGLFFSLSLKYGGMAIVNILWISISIILATLLGVFYFKEHIVLVQYMGMGLILMGMILIFSKPVSA